MSSPRIAVIDYIRLKREFKGAKNINLQCDDADGCESDLTMISVSVKKGYTLKVAGAPSLELDALDKPAHVAVLPEKIPFIKPRLKIKVGDSVKLGSVLYEDKRNPDIKFLSPGGGKITDINFGPRRVIKEIVIRLDEDEQSVEFRALTERELETIDRQQLVRILMEGGLWPLIRTLPFRDMPNPDVEPPAIFVTLGNLEPFHPKPEVYLKGKTALFRYGIKMLAKLANRAVRIAAARGDAYLFSEFKDLITHTYSGNYPAHDAGVLVYHTKKSAAENRSWYMDAQDLLLLADLVKSGKYPTERTVVIAGSLAKERKHLKTRIGAPLGHLVQGRVREGEPRYIVGGIFTGTTGSKDTFLGLFETSLTLIEEGREREVLALFRPGLDKPSYSRAFLSALNPNEFEMNSNIHGGLRACIACNHCPDVCPVDILPQLTYKAILVEEVEESLSHGLLDCVECGLCAYVCPAKIELYDVLKNAKASYYKEQA